jgi:guanosine-3',5'-bis(diphosphate) 3'-pyrophosphohydrolase
MTKLEKAELFAKEKHSKMTRKDGITPYFVHLESVVSRLKSMGIVNEDVLCAAWLHDTMEDANTSFDDIFEQFGRDVAILVSSLSKDAKLPKKERESQYVTQLKNAPFEAKLIKLCDIAANLSDLKNSDLSKTKRFKTVKTKLHYLNIIKNEIMENKANVPRIRSIIDGINDVLIHYKQKPVSI